MTPLSFPPIPICPYRVPRVGYWQFPGVSVCSPTIDNKRDLPPYASRALFLEHFTELSDSIPVFTDGSKLDAGVGFGVVFPSFFLLLLLYLLQSCLQ